jgi:hypothetical protein
MLAANAQRVLTAMPQAASTERGARVSLDTTNDLTASAGPT